MSAAVVTGASRGIGWQFARALASRGYDLVLVARDGAALEDIALRLRAEFSVVVEVCRADLSTREGLSTVRGRAAEAEVLVNNAGAGTGVSFSSTEWTAERDLLALNVLAPAALTHAALRGMLQRGRGRILNISSVAGSGPAWQGTAYGASRAFVTRLTEDLAYSRQVRRSDVAVMAAVLGHVDSNFHAAAGIVPSPPLLTLKPEFVAHAVVRALHRRRPPVRYVPSWRYRVLDTLLHHAPARTMTIPGLADDFTTSRFGNSEFPRGT
ncbi:SDR family NAD(P)-dependent oxidoreductase [Streptomyces sp. NPDC056304]|uniref:SDR family NAD(P)-dependent oxidoreductase n=1 Tax=Streptomyces sp. NPDC056304 TaxID=3345778 RepID=UPI0035E11DC9